MVCPSILSADFSNIPNTLKKMEEAGVEVVHFDVMDNHFVPNLTFGPKFIKDMRAHSSLFFDAHLMIDTPEKSLDSYLDAGADLITVHYESTHLSELLKMSEKVRSKNKKFGVSIKPKTPVNCLTPLLDKIDLALIMTVEPGFGGQKIIDNCIDKIEELRLICKENNKKIIIQADGGINKENLKLIIEKGVHWVVMGSAFFKEKDFTFFPKQFKEEIEDEFKR